MLYNPLSLGIQSFHLKTSKFPPTILSGLWPQQLKDIKQAPLSLLYRPPWASGDYYNMNALSIKYEVLFHKLTIHYTKSKESFSKGQCVPAFSFYLTTHKKLCFYRHFEPICERPLITLLLSCNKFFYHNKLLWCHFGRGAWRW